MIRAKTRSSTTPPDGPQDRGSSVQAVPDPEGDRLAYLPGRLPSKEIADDPRRLPLHVRGNLVGVVTNGTRCRARPRGPLAAKPMPGGRRRPLQAPRDIDVFDLELDAADPDRFVETVLRLEPTFGASTSRTSAPPRARHLRRLREQMTIPVFHENLDSTAVVRRPPS